MAIRKILLVTEDNDILRKVSKPVEKFDTKLHELLDDMAETMYKAKGAGLAAVQVGVLRRAFVIDTGKRKLEIINPEIIKQSGEQFQVEGCLSVKMPYGYVKRPMNVTVKALDRSGNTFTLTCTDYTAIAVCHEYDHLQGILYVDKCSKFVEDDK